MRRAAFFALTSVSLVVLMTVATMAHAVQPNVQMLGVLKAQQQWKIGTVESGDEPYCAMVGKFDQGSTLAFALSPQGFGSLGIEFQERLFKPGRKYEVELDIEKFGTRTFSGTASTARSLILQIGEDDALYDSLNRSNTLRVSTSAIEVRFEIKKFQGGYKKLVTCANVLAGPQEGQPGELPPAVMAQADMEQGEVSGAAKIFAPLRNVLQKFKGKPAEVEVAQAASVMQYAEKDIVWNDEKPAAAKTAAVVKKKSAPAIGAVEPVVAAPVAAAAAPAVQLAQATIQKTEQAAPKPQETAVPAAPAEVAEAPVRKERKLLASMAVTGHAMLAENVGMDAREMEKMQASRMEREAERKQIEMTAQAERAKAAAETTIAKTAAQVDTHIAEGPAVISAPVDGVAAESVSALAQVADARTEKARTEKERLAKIEADRNVEEERLAALEIERATKREADRMAAAERMAKIEEETRAEAVRLAKSEEETQAEIERQMKAEQERTAQLKAEQERTAQMKAEQERTAQMKAEQEYIAKAEAEQKLAAAKVEEAARAETARLAQLEADRIAKTEAEQKLAAAQAQEAARVEAARVAQVEADRKAQAERIAKIEAEQKLATAQAEETARAEAARLAQVEADRKAQAERIAKIEAEQKLATAQAEETARAEAARFAQAEADRKAEAERMAKVEAEQKLAIAQAEETARAEAARLAQVEVDRKAEAERMAKAEAEQKLAAAQAEETARAEAARTAQLKAEQEHLAQLKAEQERVSQMEADRQAERLRAEQEVARVRAEKQALENRMAAHVNAATQSAAKKPAQKQVQNLSGIEPAGGMGYAAPVRAAANMAAIPVAQRQVTAQASSSSGNRAEAFLDSIMQHHRAPSAAKPAAPVSSPAAAPAARYVPAPAANQVLAPAAVRPDTMRSQPALRNVPPSHAGGQAVTLESLLEQSGVRGAVFQPAQQDATGEVSRQWAVGRLSGLYEQMSSRGKSFDALTKDYVSRYRDDCPGQLTVKLGNGEQTPAGIVSAGTLSCKMPNNAYETALVFVQSGAEFAALLHSGHPSDTAQVKSVGDNIYYTLSSSAGLSPLAPSAAPARAPAPARVPLTGNAAAVYAPEPAARPSYAAPQTGGGMSPEPPVSSEPLFSTGGASGEFETIVVE